MASNPGYREDGFALCQSGKGYELIAQVRVDASFGFDMLDELVHRFIRHLLSPLSPSP